MYRFRYTTSEYALYCQLMSWLYSNEFKKLVKVTTRYCLSGDFSKDIYFFRQLKLLWDLRKGKERQEIKNSICLENSKNEIVECLEPLGILGIHEPLYREYDYILVLAGYGQANFDRIQKARDLSYLVSLDTSKILGLASNRSLKEEEKTLEGMETECELLEYYMGGAFGDCICVEKSFSKKQRPDTLDSFLNLLENREISGNVLMVTNEMYVQYQFLKVLPTAIKKGIKIDCIGCEEDEVNLNAINSVSKYIQEVKSVLDIVLELLKEFEDEQFRNKRVKSSW